MFSFRAFITERDITAYTNTLLMPSYMSYLCRDPLDPKQQSPNVNGREAIRLFYSGEGRLEEVLLDPDTHALAILTSLAHKINPEKIVLPSDAVWTWGREKNSDDDHSFVIHLYFKPKEELLNDESEQIFSPRDAYASVSLRKLFISNEVIKKYILQRIRMILTADSPLLADPAFENNINTPKNSASDSSSKETFDFIRAVDGYRFQFHNLAGELIFDSVDTIRDIIRFARVERSLGYISDFVSINWQKNGPENTPDGFFFDLEKKIESNEKMEKIVPKQRYDTPVANFVADFVRPEDFDKAANFDTPEDP